MSRNRLCCSLVRHRLKRRLRFSGTVAGNAPQSGDLSRTAASTSVNESPANVRRLASVSNSTHPNAQTSVLRSTGLPQACSGDMYAAVPMIMPACVISAVAVAASLMRSGDEDTAAAFASPKSSTLTCPPGVILMLAGFRSRWTMPCSWAASIPSAI